MVLAALSVSATRSTLLAALIISVKTRAKALAEAQKDCEIRKPLRNEPRQNNGNDEDFALFRRSIVVQTIFVQTTLPFSCCLRGHFLDRHPACSLQ